MKVMSVPFMRDPKMLEALEINLEQDVVKIDPANSMKILILLRPF